MGLDSHSGCYLYVSDKGNMAAPLLGKGRFFFSRIRESIHGNLGESRTGKKRSRLVMARAICEKREKTAGMMGKDLAFRKRGKPGQVSMDFAMYTSCEKGLRKPGGQHGLW